MIQIRSTGNILKNPGSMKSLSPEDRKQLRYDEQAGDLKFIVPERFTDNAEKNLYKIGFMAEFLTELYPQSKFDVICEALNERHQIFLGKRQIERNRTRFINDEYYVNDD